MILFGKNGRMNMAFWAAAIPAIAGVASSVISANSAKDAQETTQASTKEQMDFQERMSNTAHRREVEDLKLAGLNPVLSAGGSGASSPAGSSFVGTDILGPAARSGLSTAMQAMMMDKQIDNMVETNKNIAADTKLKEQQEWSTLMQGRLAAQTMASVHEDVMNKQVQNRILLNEEEIGNAASAKALQDEELVRDAPWLRKIGAVLRELGLTGNNMVNSAQRVRR